MPLVSKPVLPDEPALTVARSGTGAKILVVDDDPVNLRVLANHLKSSDYDVVLSQDGRGALSILDSDESLDMVILDVMMPQMNGYEVCRRIRESRPQQELPVIMLTAKNQVRDLVEGFSVGANDYLAKPVFRDEVLSRIRTHLLLSKINISYGRFVPQEFLTILNKESIIDVMLGDHVQLDMAIMFCDIRDFTVLSESMSPAETFGFINEYLGRIVQRVRENGGVVDKYMGDAVMALFPQSTESAINAAVAMQAELEAYNGERKEAGLVPIRSGIGLHWGSLILGTVGEEHRLDETVISDAVNLASRIEGLTKRFDAPILVSGPLVENLSQHDSIALRFLGKVRVKGKRTPTAVHELLPHASKYATMKEMTCARFEEGLRLFYDRKFAEATVAFQQVLAEDNLDTAARIYRDRSARFVVTPPSEDWDGVEDINTK